ncbi:unnamed protein product [Dovyalis caffra]|uniref:Uncharacterized protein n=1 Tax=Dovyalis caffra TaxID=77055 RepID=A0AAV1S237_9ROSI|nr:unnamed protein product [Dovyalis caffra]
MATSSVVPRISGLERLTRCCLKSHGVPPPVKLIKEEKFEYQRAASTELQQTRRNSIVLASQMISRKIRFHVKGRWRDGFRSFETIKDRRRQGSKVDD